MCTGVVKKDDTGDHGETTEQRISAAFHTDNVDPSGYPSSPAQHVGHNLATNTQTIIKFLNN